MSEACQRRVVRGVSEACQRRIIWIKLHSVAMPTALPKGRYRCRKNLEAALKATEGGSLKGIDLGAEDGNLLNKPMSSLVPSHALLAGPPCPPWPAVRQESQPAAKRQRWNLDPNLTKEFENFTKYTM